MRFRWFSWVFFFNLLVGALNDEVAFASVGDETDLIQNQYFGRRKNWILKRKSRFGGFRHRWFQIWWSRIEIRKELEKVIFKFPKSNFGTENWKSKSKFEFWGADFWILGIDFEFLSPNFKNLHLAKYPKILFAKFFFNWIVAVGEGGTPLASM